MSTLYFLAMAAACAGVGFHILFVAQQYRTMKAAIAGMPHQGGELAILEHGGYLAWALSLGLLVVHQGLVVLAAIVAGTALSLLFGTPHRAEARSAWAALEKLLPAQVGCAVLTLLYTGAFSLPAVAIWPWLALAMALSRMTAEHAREVRALVSARGLPVA